MALKKQIVTNSAGQVGEYIRFESIEPPMVSRKGLGPAMLTMAVYRDETAAKVENREAACLKRYAIPGTVLLGMTLDEFEITAQWVYQHIRELVSEYVDAEDVIDQPPEPEEVEDSELVEAVPNDT